MSLSLFQTMKIRTRHSLKTSLIMTSIPYLSIIKSSWEYLILCCIHLALLACMNSTMGQQEYGHFFKMQLFMQGPLYIYCIMSYINLHYNFYWEASFLWYITFLSILVMFTIFPQIIKCKIVFCLLEHLQAKLLMSFTA